MRPGGIWRNGCALPLALCAVVAAFSAVPVHAEAPAPQLLRLATWNADLSRRGPGLLLADLARYGKGDKTEGTRQIAAVIEVLRALDADVLVLTGVDFDTRLMALAALGARLDAAGLAYPHLLALPPNSGIPTGLDLDRDGRLGGARDAMGYGWFQGEGGIALLSRLPLRAGDVQDYTGFLWRDLPGQTMPPDTPEAERAIQRLSSVNHWQIGVELPGGGRLGVMAFVASPPVFDGPEKRNLRRNHDESAFWLRLMEGALPYPAPAPPFVLMGQVNMDPEDGDGRPDAIRALLSDPRLQDAAPRGRHGRSEPGHRGDPALDTALYDGPGGLRVDYVLPSADLQLRDAGVLWPADGALAAALPLASRHAPVWVDIELPAARPPD